MKKPKMKKPSKFGLFFCVLFSATLIAIAWISLDLEHFPEVTTSSVSHSVFTDPVCQYKGCGGEAVREVEVTFSGYEKGKRVRESENYSVNGKSYDRTETGYVPKKDTYLVPTDKGLKVETERGWEEKTYVTGTGMTTTIKGYYCAEHEDAGKKLIEGEVMHAFILGTFFGEPDVLFVFILTVLSWALLLRSCFKGEKKGAPAKMAKAADSKKP